MKITEIKKVQTNPVYVYDITVKNTLNAQNFLVDGNVILKNCGPVCHGAAIAAGSPDTFSESMPHARVGDPVDCGSMLAVGSGDVFTN